MVRSGPRRHMASQSQPHRDPQSRKATRLRILSRLGCTKWRGDVAICPMLYGHRESEEAYGL